MFNAALILLAVLFIGTAAHYADVLQRVRIAWLLAPSLKSTKKVKPFELEPPLPHVPLEAANHYEAGEGIESKKKDELKRVFKTFDKDGDGYITRQELREAVKGAGVAMEESEIEEMAEKMDGNGDGLIDLSEFCKSFEMGIEDDEGVLREAFEVFDGNKDGVISVEELGMIFAVVRFEVRLEGAGL